MGPVFLIRLNHCLLEWRLIEAPSCATQDNQTPVGEIVRCVSRSLRPDGPIRPDSRWWAWGNLADLQNGSGVAAVDCGGRLESAPYPRDGSRRKRAEFTLFRLSLPKALTRPETQGLPVAPRGGQPASAGRAAGLLWLLHDRRCCDSARPAP